MRDEDLACDDVAEETLAANRAGRMTDEQRAALASWRAADIEFAPTLTCSGVLFVLLAIVGAILDRVFGARSSGRGARWPGLLEVAIGFLAFAVIAALYRRRRLAAAKEDAREGRVIAVEGQCTKQLSIERYGRASKSVNIGGRRFDLSRRGRLFRTLVEGRSYRAYLAPRSGRLLSIEPARPRS